MDADRPVPPITMRSSLYKPSVAFTCDNILMIVKGVKDWWSKGDYYCIGGGLGYWLAVSSDVINQIRTKYGDPEEQKRKLIEAWMEFDVFPSWHRLGHAVQRVGETQLVSDISTYEVQPPTGMPFTCSNVLRAVKSVEDWWGVGGLGHNLFISKEKRDEIQRMYSDPEEQKRQLILYWMNTDPRASWRRLITHLDRMSESPVADGIRDFAEPLPADASLTLHNIYQVTSTVDYAILRRCLMVPYSVYSQIEANPSYSTEEKKRKAVINYLLNTIPHVSWALLAGRLYLEEQHVSLEAVRKNYLHHMTESSHNLHNLNKALETLPDEEWDGFGLELYIPVSKRDEIESKYSSIHERKSALLGVYLNSHPAPSWKLVVDALYRGGRSKYVFHTVLETVQRMYHMM